MTRSGTPPDDGKLDVAIVGAGAAGTYVAYRLIQGRPDWRIAVFERSNRIGGRLWSVPIEGLAHPIELGGMRYMTGHVRVHSVVTELGIETRHFDPAHRPERLFLRGIVGESPDDPNAGSAYDLPAGEAGRSAPISCAVRFSRSCRWPVSSTRSAGVSSDLRRPWEAGGLPIGRSMRLSRRSSVRRAIGSRPTRSGTTQVSTRITPAMRSSTCWERGYPSGEARVPVGGMDRIPRELAARFEAGGGMMRLGHELRRVETSEGSILLGFAGGSRVRSRRLVLTLPIPALEALAGASPLINGPTWRRL